MAGINEDFKIWQQFKKGDKSAFGQIYSEYAPGLILYGKSFTNDIFIIEDTVHDLFLYLHNSSKGIKDTDNIRVYLYRSFRNNIIRNISLRNNEIKKVSEYYLSEKESEGAADKFLEPGKLEKFIESLSPQQNEIICLRFFNNLSNSDICNILGLENQTVKNVICMSLKKLRKMVAEELKKTT